MPEFKERALCSHSGDFRLESAVPVPGASADLQYQVNVGVFRQNECARLDKGPVETDIAKLAFGKAELIVGDHGLDPGKSPLSGAPIGRLDRKSVV